MNRLGAVLLAIGLAASGCGGSSGSKDDEASSTPATDSYGNPLKVGQDWSGAGKAKGAGDPAGSSETGNGGSESGSSAGGADGGAASGSTPTTIPYGCNEGDGDEPPPDAAGPLANASSNEFPMKAVVTPIRGDAGTEITIDVTAVAAPDGLVTIVASFYDSSDHGMRAAKFADATGRARFKGPIPADAPLGWAAVAVSVTTREEPHRSAIDIVNFVVTGEGCP